MDVRAVPYISVRLVKHLFHTRFRLAALTRRSKLFNRVVIKTMFDKDDMIVVPKDNVARRVVEANIEIEDPGQTTVLPSDVVKDIISRSEDIFIMNFCLCRRSSGCKDYPIDHGCVFLGEGTRRIPPEFGRKATAEEANRYIDECGELGFVHIIGRNKLDSIWLNTGKRDLMTICNCCPCCCLWNMVSNVSDEIGSSFRRMDGVTVTMDPEKCVGCGSCRDICFCKAVNAVDGRFEIDQTMCRGCGRCVEQCPAEAISITYTEGSVEREIEKIGSLVKLSPR